MAKLIPRKTINLVKKLRSEGWSLPEIHRKTKIGYGSVFRYIKGVQILDQYKSSWQEKRKPTKKMKILLEKQAQQKAAKDLRNLTRRDILVVFACLYWAEGNKKDFIFTNTDSGMIKVFLKCMEMLGVTKNDIKITIRTYEDLDKRVCINYWAKIADIPPSQIFSINIIKGKKAGKLPYGMCRIRIVKGGNMLKYAVALRDRLTKIISPNSSTDRTEVS